MHLHPLGDQAVLAYLPDEATAANLAAAARAADRPDWLDVVPAYASVAIHFDPDRTCMTDVVKNLRALDLTKSNTTLPRRHVIPCCYELGPDLDLVARMTGLSVDAVVRLHTGVDLMVYAIGFCPGFPYLGYLPPELSGTPRLPRPRRCVEAGSVGLTGRQTGIYPLERPGGWNLIGRTPSTIVDISSGYFPLRVGDRVRFQRIDSTEFDRTRGQRLDDARS
jgi:inhibitor of KinA